MYRADIDVILEARKLLWEKEERLSTQEDFTKLWDAVSAEIREKLLEGKASQLVNVGTFSVSKWWHGGKLVQTSPEFALSGRLVRKFGVRENRKWSPEVAPRLLTAATVSGASAQGLRGATKCLAALQSALRNCVANGYASLTFPGIGTLLVVRHVARMTFERAFLEEFRRREWEARRGTGQPPPPQSPPESPPTHKPSRRPLLVMGPPRSRRHASHAHNPQVSQGELTAECGEARQAGPLSELKKQLRASASRRHAAGRGACNLTACSRHSRHAASQEPRIIPELPDMQERRREMEIAEYYRRKEREKYDKEGVWRMYEQECELILAKRMREAANKERRRRMRLLRASQAQGDTLSTSRTEIKKAVKRGSAKAGVPLKSSAYPSNAMCPA